MEGWTFDQRPTSSGTTPTPFFIASDISSASAINGAGLTTSFATTTGNPGNDCTGTGFSNLATPNTSLNDYFQFAVDTANYIDVSLSFDASRSNTAPAAMQVYYSTGGAPTALAGTYAIGITYATYTANLNGLTNTSCVTFICIYSWNSGVGTGRLDNATFTGCRPATPTPTSTATSTPTSTGTLTNTPTATSTRTRTTSPTNTPTPASSNTPTSTSTAYPKLSVIINEVDWAGTAASSMMNGWNFTILLAQI